MHKKHAFTLIELLVTSAILVSLATLTASIFSSVGRLQVGRKSAETLAATARQIQARLDEDIQRADHMVNLTDYPVEIRSVSVSRSNGLVQREDVLALRVALQNDQGLLNGQKAWHVYCNEESTRRLVRLVFSNTTLQPGVLSSINGVCTEAGIKTMMSGGISDDPTKEYLTDERIQVSNLKFIQARPPEPLSVYDAVGSLYTVPIIRYEMRLRPTDTSLGVFPVMATGVVTRTSWFGQLLP